MRWLRKHADDPVNAARRWIVERYQYGVAMFDPQGLTARYKTLVAWQGGKWVNYWTETVPKDIKSKPAVNERSVESSASLKRDSAHSRGSSASSIRMDNDTAFIANGIITTTSEDISYVSSETETASIGIANDPSEDDTAKTMEKENKKTKAAKRFFKRRGKEENLAKGSQKTNSKRHFVVLPDGLAEHLGGLERWERVEIAGVEDEVNAHLGLFIPGNNLDYEGLVVRIGEKILGWCEDLPKVQSSSY